MTVSNLNFENSYTTDGVTSAYSFTFAATDPAQVQVFLNGVQQMSGFNTALSLVVAGGTVTFTSPPTTGQTLLLYRSSDLLQNDELFTNAQLPPATVEAMIDKLTIICQQLNNQFAQTPQAPNGSGITNNLTGVGGAALANFLIGLDPTGLLFEFLNPVTVFQNAFPGGGLGNVVGPASSVSGNLAKFNSTNGQLIADTGIAASAVYTPSNPPPAQILTQVRAYLVSGQPFADGSNAGNATLYAGPLPTGNKVTVDNGSGVLSVVSLTEISLALTLTANSAYSVFLVNTAGVQSLEVDVWSNQTTPLTYGTDGAGRRCKSGATNKLLIAEVQTNATANKLFDWTGTRNIVNQFNKMPASLTATDASGNWAGTGSIESSHGNTTDGVGRVSFFVGSDPMQLVANAFQVATGGATDVVNLGIGVNSTSAFTVKAVFDFPAAGGGQSTGTVTAALVLTTGPQYIQRLDNSPGTSTLIGSAGQNGLSTLINK